jgi:hypothetical protein
VHAAIETERAFEVGDFEMDMTDPGTGGDGIGASDMTSPKASFI